MAFQHVKSFLDEGESLEASLADPEQMAGSRRLHDEIQVEDRLAVQLYCSLLNEPASLGARRQEDQRVGLHRAVWGEPSGAGRQAAFRALRTRKGMT